MTIRICSHLTCHRDFFLPQEIWREKQVVLQHYSLVSTGKVSENAVKGEADVGVGAIAEDAFWAVHQCLYAHHGGQGQRLLVGAVHHYKYLRLAAARDSKQVPQ